MADSFDSRIKDGKDGKYVSFFITEGESYTPSDAGRFQPSQLYVGGGGNIRVVLSGEVNPVTFTNVPSGTFLPIKAIAVFASGTTATNILTLR